MKRLLAAALLSAAAILPAQADSVVVLGGQNWTINGNTDFLTLGGVPSGNQPQNIQCIICGANQPQQAANFGYTDFGNQGNQTSLVYFSTNVSGGADPGLDTVGIPYGQGFLANYLQTNGNSLNFSVGIDINDNNQTQTLNSFFFLNLSTHTVLAAYTTDTPLPDLNNGTGFPDYQLNGFSLTSADIHPGDNLLFFARMSNLNDGPDSFFIQPAAVPGPIVGAGLPGLISACFGLWGFNRFRRRRTVA